MGDVTWSGSVADPAGLAWTFSLLSSRVDDAAAGDELRASWGSFSLSVLGVNVCANEQQGESLQAAHWYLLPLAEWLVDNWDALFHEQRLPLPGVPDAATAWGKALAHLDAEKPSRSRPWGFVTADDDDLFEQVQEWAYRHRLVTAAPEAPLPDVWLRRRGTGLEVSRGTSDRPLLDSDVRWTAGLRVCEVPVQSAADVTERALRALLGELKRRHPDGCAAKTLRRMDETVAAGRSDERLAWLIGLQGDTVRLEALREDLDRLADVDGHARQETTSPATNVLLATPVATLFGSLSPLVAASDLHALVGALSVTVAAPGLLDALNDIAEGVPEAVVRDLPGGEAGGDLGDAVAAWLPVDDGQVAVARFLQELGVAVVPVALSDPTLRAVTLLHDDGRAVVVLNTSYERGNAGHVVRFTLAHELGHLIYDRAGARTLAVASGPWTPRRVEQRANGFAAGLLMPERLLRDALAGEADPADDPAVLPRIARRLGVSVTALAERLPNAGLLSRSVTARALERLLDQP